MELDDYADNAWVRTGVWWCMFTGVVGALYLVWRALALVPECIDAMRPF